MSEPATILVVDDLPQNVRLLEAVLAPAATPWSRPTSGREALERVGVRLLDLVLLDIVMPEMDGYEICRALRADPATSFPADRDDHGQRRTGEGRRHRVGSRRLHRQAVRSRRVARARRLAAANQAISRHDRGAGRRARGLEPAARAAGPGAGRGAGADGTAPALPLPQLAEVVLSSGDESFLESHRREITVVFCDLRGFTAFAETVEPEDLMLVLSEYHAALGDLVHRFEGTLERFTGDGLMVIFNDPLPCPDAPQRAVRMAVAMRGRVSQLAEEWSRRAMTWTSASASRRATRRSVRSASRDAPTTQRSGASRTWLPVCAGRRRRGRS